MQQDLTPAERHLLFIGGGHAHAIALLMLAMNKPPGVRITLISDRVQTPYSGMLPGLIAGHYSYDQVHIDLGRFCRYAGIDFIEDRVTGIQPETRTVQCLNHPDFKYDLLCIDTGSTPDLSGVKGAQQHCIGVKPVTQLLDYWDTLQQRLIDDTQAEEIHIGAIGGGASAVEVILAMQHRLTQLMKAHNRSTDHIHYHIICGPEQILPSHNTGVQQRYRKVIRKRGVHLHTGFRVTEVRSDQVIDDQGNTLMLDEIIWATAASGADWPARAGLECAENGCIKVNDFLQSVSHPDIFATGDIADMVNHPRPKAGVFAVRQGAPLAHNLKALLEQKKLKPYKPQTQFLSLISTGDKNAVASRGQWSIGGRWVWWWKNHIDQKFMRRFSDLTQLPDAEKPNKAIQIENPDMRCGGCGAKVGHTILRKVLQRLPETPQHIPVGLQKPDDAAVIEVPPGQLLVQSVDSFRQLINDDYLFGQVVANHALGDLFAMGADPHSAQAIVTLPYASDQILEQRLEHLISGANKVFSECGISLIGGHTSEGSELALGFVVNGLADQACLLTKQGLAPGDAIILTKPVGTGTLFASDMRAQAQGRWISRAIRQMLQSNYPASQIFTIHQIKACTDVTGFGLLGHLSEMLEDSLLCVDIQLDALPALEGAEACLQAGLFSSLHPQNRRFSDYIDNLQAFSKHPKLELLFDPQTAGGLLAAVPAEKTEQIIQELEDAGFSDACVIGQVSEQSSGAPVRLR
ncbi:MAG: selenide, water dikinase SelD [Amphritea sp.]|nr:selenide, water dikinase SelD [Amphritea sp.]